MNHPNRNASVTQALQVHEFDSSLPVWVDRHSHWINEKTAVVKRLIDRELGGGYDEAAILICAMLSAMSKTVWPGRSIDRARFVELLVHHGSEAEICRHVSVPILCEHLEANRRGQEAEALRHAFRVPKSALVITGAQVDRLESDVISVCPELSLKLIRSHSYANLLYEDLRSSYAHEYQPGPRVDIWEMTMRIGEKVSYVNRAPRAPYMEMTRAIFFQVDWLIALTRSIAENLDALPESIQPPPSSWWIHVERADE